MPVSEIDSARWHLPGMTEFRIPQKALDELAASNVILLPTREPDPFEGLDSVAVSTALGAPLSGETVEGTAEPQEPLATPEEAADPRAEEEREDRYAKIVKGLTRNEDGSYSGFVCAECRRPVDPYIRGAHDPGCPLAFCNESLLPDADLYQRFAKEHADA